MEILLATHNNHKIQEFKQIFPDFFKLISLSDLNIYEDIKETGKTFQENAKIKSEFGFLKTNIPCFADDSGIVIEALNGDPGIFSSRYSESGNSLDNINKVLLNLKNKINRKAYFICVISFTNKSGTYFFEGKIHGEILTKIQGNKGFGYDPIFKPNDYSISFAQMNPEEKNKISHRTLAFDKFLDFLTNISS